jgi:hypothetical protein
MISKVLSALKNENIPGEKMWIVMITAYFRAPLAVLLGTLLS